MRVPMNWLQEFIDIDVASGEIAEKLTGAGVEVEGIDHLIPELPGVVVAEVLSFTQHPAADKLWIVKVSTGDGEHQVVAGINNYVVGDKVPLALPGAILPAGPIGKTEIRGVTSNGMLCSAEELGLEALAVDQDGILILGRHQVPGTTLLAALGLDDEILELGLTPNRADCLGLLGVAVEVGVLTGKTVKPPQAVPHQDGSEAADRVKVTILDPELCHRYTAMLVEGVTVAPSPVEFQVRLLQAGIRPINNVVDISNYVMWETGQPLHTFDFDCLQGQKIIVRKAQRGEKITTLDKQERTLREDMLVIADQDTPVALAGVMGGFDSEITEASKTVLVEAARFHPVNNRRTARSLGLKSEASTRFEKGVDPTGTEFAARRTAYLLEKLAGGRVVPGLVDVYPVKIPLRTIDINPQRVRDVLGFNLPTEKMRVIFEQLGFTVTEKEDRMSVTVPTRRFDIEIEVDLVEELARIYGYEHIKTTFPVGVMTQGEKPREQKNLDIIKKILLGAGVSEVITFAFMKEAAFDALRIPQGHLLRRAIPVKNPLSEEQGILRTTLMGNLLDTVRYNLNRQQEDIYIFETGKTFVAEKLPLTSQPDEKVVLGMVITGKRGEKHWQESPPEAGFYWLKGVVEGVFQALNLKGLTFKPAQVPYLHPTQGALICHEEQVIGTLGSVHPGVLDNYDITEKVFSAEIDLTSVITRTEPLNYKALPRYPAISRDIALTAPVEVPAAAVEHIIKEAGGELVEKVLLFDMYTGEQVAKGCKSLAYTVVYRNYQETLRDERVNEIQGDILRALQERLGVTLRS